MYTCVVVVSFLPMVMMDAFLLLLQREKVSKNWDHRLAWKRRLSTTTFVGGLPHTHRGDPYRRIKSLPKPSGENSFGTNDR